MYKILGSFCIFFLLCQTSMANDQVRDPTTPLGHVTVSTAQAINPWVLSAVLISPGRKLAVINGSTLREGQILPESAGTKVQRILAQTVIVQRGDQTWVLKLSPGVVKKHSSIQQNN